MACICIPWNLLERLFHNLMASGGQAGAGRNFILTDARGHVIEVSVKIVWGLRVSPVCELAPKLALTITMNR
jgi:hypothetical protein